MKILARQITVDMYNCKAIDIENHKARLHELYDGIEGLGYKIIDIRENVQDEENLIIFILLKEGHLTFRYYPSLSYLACDFFICQELSKPEKAINLLRKIAKPDKVRMTYLKRGDFGTLKDVKPKIKIRTARLRQLRTKSAKVIKNVAKKIKVPKK